MERLTKRSGEMVWLKKGELCLEPCEIMSSCDAKDIRNILVRLAAYEDTGLTPEEIVDFRENYRIAISRFADYKAAEASGRMVVLPCKVGDLLYEVDLPEYGVIICKVLSVLHYCGPEHHIPGNQIVSAVDVQVEVIEGHGKGSSYDFSQEDFGKTVFLTREAAETALKERKG